MIRVQLLHAFDLSSGGTRISVQDSGQRVVALLALSEGRVDRTSVAGVLWPDVSQRNALASLRTTIWRIQKACPGLLDATAFDLALARSAVVDVDERLRLGRRVLSGDAGDLENIPLSAFGVELLPGWNDDWVLVERERVRQLDLHILQVAALHLATQRRFGAALEIAWHLLQLDALRESAHEVVIKIHLAEGNVRDALRQYELCERLLWRELGVRPTRHLQDLARCAPPVRSAVSDVSSARVRRLAARVNAVAP